MTSNQIFTTLKGFLWALLIVGVTELAARYVLFPEYKALLPELYRKHPVLGYHNMPNLEARRYGPMNYDVINRTNSMGLRGLEKNREKELSGIWLAGSSNTFGGYVEDDEVLSARLSQAGYPTANLASEGQGIGDQAKMIRYLGDMGYRPRAVIINLTMFTAINSYAGMKEALNMPLPSGGQKTEKKSGTARERLLQGVMGLWNSVPRTWQSLRGKLLKSSALYGWMKVGVMGVPVLRDWTLKVGLRADIDLAQNFNVDFLRPLEENGPALRQIDATAEYMGALGDYIHNRFNVPFGVVLIPSRQQIYPDRLQRNIEYYGLQGEILDATLAISALKKSLQEQNVPVLDTLPALVKRARGPLNFPDNGHITAEGHAIVAHAISEWLPQGMGLERLSGTSE